MRNYRTNTTYPRFKVTIKGGINAFNITAIPLTGFSSLLWRTQTYVNKGRISDKSHYLVIVWFRFFVHVLSSFSKYL